jgi:uncharacterized protein GlcG (DUF336 family)
MKFSVLFTVLAVSGSAFASDKPAELKHAGGIGVSGARSTEDEQCAMAALE